ncbi:MAG TPA: antitoxin Xre-like helix-turn-helix domain-containing protein [Ramlibacter sp.]|nr:antitoxin Xre-like helix-turn-helix domain-containing protein [Ramlibacter sp.]
MVSKAPALVPRTRKSSGPLPRRLSGLSADSSARALKLGTSFIEVYRAEPLTRITIIKDGLPADYLDVLSRRLNMTKERLLPTLGIAQATVSRKVREAKPLSSEDSERALGMARLIGQVEAMVQESGDPTGFDAAKWLARWLDEPLAALNGRPPSSLMDTAEGQTMVSNLLARMQSGAYA